MEEVGHGKREMSCGVSEWMAGSQNWNGGKKKEGDMHGEISKSRSVNCGAMGLEEDGEREGSAAIKSSSPGGASRSDKEITSVMVAAKPGQ